MASPPDDSSSPPPPSDAEIASHLGRIHGWRGGIAAVTEPQQFAIEGAVSDADALSRGTETSASDVLHETLNALVRLDVLALVSAHADVLRYAKFRVRYLFDRVIDLEEALRAQGAQSEAWSAAQITLANSLSAGRLVRTDLLNALGRATRSHPDLAEAVSRRRGTSALAPNLIASLTGLADLIEEWLANSDHAVLLESSSISARDVNKGRTAASTLRAADLRAGEATAAPRDLPRTNVIEGRLMSELHELYRALQEGREAVPTLPTMVLGDTLQRCFRRLRGAPAEVAEPKPGDPTPTPTE